MGCGPSSDTSAAEMERAQEADFAARRASDMHDRHVDDEANEKAAIHRRKSINFNHKDDAVDADEKERSSTQNSKGGNAPDEAETSFNKDVSPSDEQQ